MSLRPLSLLKAALTAIALPGAVLAQAPGNGQTTAARLEQLDETYHSNLRKYHAPIIQDYLVSLEKLKETMVKRGRSEGVPAVQEEIERVKKLSTGTGLLSYDVLKAAPPKEKPDAPPSEKTTKKSGQTSSIILAASAAKSTTPSPSSPDEKPDGRAVPIGSAEWQTEKIPAGDYRISILYSCAGKPSDSTIVARLGQNSVQHALTAANATGGVNEFRIAKLGVVSLEKDIIGESLVLQNQDPAATAIWVRQVIISKHTDAEKK